MGIGETKGGGGIRGLGCQIEGCEALLFYSRISCSIMMLLTRRLFGRKRGPTEIKNLFSFQIDHTENSVVASESVKVLAHLSSSSGPSSLGLVFVLLARGTPF